MLPGVSWFLQSRGDWSQHLSSWFLRNSKFFFFHIEFFFLISKNTFVWYMILSWLFFFREFKSVIPLKLFLSVLSCCRCLVAQSCLALCDPMNRSPQGFSVHGTPQARYWSGLPSPPPGDLSDTGREPASLTSPASAGGFLTSSTTREAQVFSLILFLLCGNGDFSSSTWHIS